MKKIIFILLITFLFGTFCYAGEKSDVIWEYGYVGGYAGGVEERENSYPCNPTEYYELSIIQTMLTAVKLTLAEQGLLTSEPEFNKHFKAGFIDGYKDGYYNRTKKKSKYGFGK